MHQVGASSRSSREVDPGFHHRAYRSAIHQPTNLSQCLIFCCWERPCYSQRRILEHWVASVPLGTSLFFDSRPSISKILSCHGAATCLFLPRRDPLLVATGCRPGLHHLRGVFPPPVGVQPAVPCPVLPCGCLSQVF